MEAANRLLSLALHVFFNLGQKKETVPLVLMHSWWFWWKIWMYKEHKILPTSSQKDKISHSLLQGIREKK